MKPMIIAITLVIGAYFSIPIIEGIIEYNKLYK